MLPNHVTSIIVRHALNTTIFLGVFHITSTSLLQGWQGQLTSLQTACFQGMVCRDMPTHLQHSFSWAQRMPPLHFANGVCHSGAWKASGLDIHQHPIEVKHESFLASTFWLEKEVPRWRVGQEDAFKQKTQQSGGMVNHL